METLTARWNNDASDKFIELAQWFETHMGEKQPTNSSKVSCTVLNYLQPILNLDLWSRNCQDEVNNIGPLLSINATRLFTS